MMKKIFLSALFFLNGICIHAQNTESVAMADAIREDGKIYVVVCVLAIIFTILLIYLISLDRKISSLEKKSSNKK